MRSSSRPMPGIPRLLGATAAAFLVMLLAGCPKPPNVPDAPHGPVKWLKQVVLACTTSTTDPSGGSVSYQFDWGDVSQSEWSAYTAGGTAFADTHTYQNPGVYEVKARARNQKGRESDWSAPLTIQVDPGEGEVRWSFGYAPDPESPEDSADLSSSTFARGLDGNFYLSGGDGSALLARNQYGNRRWEYPDPDYDEFATPAITTDSSILCGTNGGTLYLLDTRGVKRWEVSFTAGIPAPAALGPDGTIYVQTEDDTMFALDPASGARRWWFHRNGGMAPPVVGTDGTVIVCHDDSIFALEPAAGAVKWRYGTAQNIYSAPAIDPGRGAAYVGDEDGNFASLDLSDGSENWRASIGSTPSSPVIGPGGTVYVCGSGQLYELDPQNGGASVLYQPPLAGLASTPAVSADDRIYFLVISDKRDFPVATDSLYAVSSAGDRRWACGLGSASGTDVLSAPKIDADGYVYVGDGNRGWCVVGSGGPAVSPWPMFQHDIENSGRARQ